LPNAKKFKHWVTSEVLPTIRKTGHYETPGYTPKATSVGEVVNLIKVTRQTMKEQGATPTEIATAVKEICEQFGVNLPQCFIKPKETTMTDVMQMIDFIYSQPKGRGHKTPTYDDFIIYQASLKRLGG
jgi:MarR-like DNA-binding transcriptional regulator SgrR of sgrS sRNA